MAALGNGVYDTVVFASMCCVLLATFIAALRDARRHQLWSRIRWAAPRAVRALRSWSKAERDEVSTLVQARLQELRVEHFRWCCRCMCIMFTPYTMLVAYNITLEQQRSYTAVQELALMALQAILSWCVYRPSSVSRRTIDAFHGAIAISGVVFVFPGATGRHLYPTHLIGPILCLAVLGFARRSLLINLATACLLSAAAYATLAHHRDSVVQTVPMLMSFQVTFQIVMAFTAQVLDATLGETIRSGMEMREAQELIQAASALLKSTCDAVVELDSEGVILSPGNDLADLLLRGHCHRFQNSRFADVIAHEEDRERFSRKLSSPTTSGTEMAEAIHVHMRDGNNDTIRTQVLWFRFRRVDGQQRYMVGIREFSDTSAVGSLPQASPRHRAAADRDSDSDGDASLGTSEASVDSLMTEEEHLAVVTVDSTDPQLLVLSCSQGFCMRIGRLAPGTALQQRVRRSEDFLRWLQAAVNAVLEGGDRPQCHVSLNMRQGRVRATCRILVKASEEGEVLDMESVHLLFFDIRQNPGHGGRRQDGRPSSGSQLRGTPVVHISM